MIRFIFSFAPLWMTRGEICRRVGRASACGESAARRWRPRAVTRAAGFRAQIRAATGCREELETATRRCSVSNTNVSARGSAARHEEGRRPKTCNEDKCGDGTHANREQRLEALHLTERSVAPDVASCSSQVVKAGS